MEIKYRCCSVAKCAPPFPFTSWTKAAEWNCNFFTLALDLFQSFYCFIFLSCLFRSQPSWIFFYIHYLCSKFGLPSVSRQFGLLSFLLSLLNSKFSEDWFLISSAILISSKKWEEIWKLWTKILFSKVTILICQPFIQLNLLSVFNPWFT